MTPHSGEWGLPLETRLQMLLDVIQKVVHDDCGQLAPKQEPKKWWTVIYELCCSAVC